MSTGCACIRRVAFAVAALLVGAFATAGGAAEEGDEYATPQFRELPVVLPDPPRPESLLAFYVSPTSANRFYVDAASLSVGADGVIRYTLVVDAAGGARNVSFEGIRCESRGFRLYATGRVDGSWVKARSDDWRRIVDKPVNRHHSELYFNYFCPNGSPVADAAVAKAALRSGGHPDAVRGRP